VTTAPQPPLDQEAPSLATSALDRAAPGSRPARTRSRAKEPIITARGLTKMYGTFTAVDRLNLDVYPGEIFGLLGPNGAGKTTTILMMLGLSEPTSGEVRVAGLDPTRRPLDVKRRVGYLPDDAGFYPTLTGRQNLRYTARLNSLARGTAEDRISTVLAQVGLADRADDRVETYSRGMRQRLGIADALVKDPDILILDEPTVAIDPIGVAEMLDLMRRLVQGRGIALLLASHLLDQVQSVCDRVGIFSAGRLINVGSVDELARRYGGDRSEILVGVEAAPRTDAAAIGARLASQPGVVAVEPRPMSGDGDLNWALTLDPKASESETRAAVLRAILADGLLLTRLTRTSPSLDQIYRTAVEGHLATKGRVEVRSTEPGTGTQTSGGRRPRSVGRRASRRGPSARKGERR